MARDIDLTVIPAYVGDEQVVHVYPIGDSREHQCNRMECWCRPILNEDAGYVVVHNSADGRELFERGQRKSS